MVGGGDDTVAVMLASMLGGFGYREESSVRFQAGMYKHVHYVCIRFFCFCWFPRKGICV